MDRSYIEKYKSEMMKLYGKSRESAPDVVTENVTDNIENNADEEESVSYEPENGDEGTPDDTAYENFPEEDREESGDIEDEFNQRYPEPDLSDLDTDTGELEISGNETAPDYTDEDELGDSVGYIRANVRAGDESSPVMGATVAVTAVVDGRRLVLASGLTDRNGTTKKFSLPVPDEEHSQSPDPQIRPYSLYDVTVNADGYFTARSVDVPVFSGITSVQNFNMIPVPLMMNSNSETLTYYNKEPDYKEGSE